VRAELPHIERVLLQPEAPADPHRKIAMPLADLTGAISDHFGEAPYFAFVTLAAATGKVEEQRIRANPYKDEERGKGLRVAEWLVAEKVDTVLLFRSLKGKGPEYVFRDAGVAVQLTRCRTLPEAISVSSGETGEGRRRLAGDEQEEKM
jgi:predicted Fe-Mo cluster-binding NifX family protein